MRALRASAGIIALVSVISAHAQPNAGALLNQQERQQQQPPQRLPEITKPERPPLKAVPGARVEVVAIRFSGAVDLVPEAQLQAVVADAIGRKLGIAGLRGLALRVTDYLHAQGWFLAQAYLPQQDVTAGRIEIAIRAGHLDSGRGTPFSIEPRGAVRIRNSRLEAIAARLLPPGARAKQDQLERALLLMNDLPGITARARLQPGVEPDATHVRIEVAEGPLLGGSAWVDNYGNRDTGGNQLNVAAQFNDPAQIGDQLTANATHSQGLALGRLGYHLPLGSGGLRLGGSFSAMDYTVLRGAGVASGLTGTSRTAGALLTYPLTRSRRQNLYASLGYTRKALTDDSAAGVVRDKRVDVWNLGLSGDRQDLLGGGGVTNWNVNWTGGRLDLSLQPQDAAADAATYRTAGHYDKLNAGLVRLQRLPGGLTLRANFSGQIAADNLDSSEQFILGGPYGVRAYPVGEGSGDGGWLTNLELRYDLPAMGTLGEVQLVGFYDMGAITLHRHTNNVSIATASGRNRYTLSGWGLGANLSKGGRYTVHVAWARAIGENPGRSASGLNNDGSDDKSRFWLLASVTL